MTEYFHRLLVFDNWANTRTLESIAAADNPPSKAIKWMAHIVAAEWLWLQRLKGEKQSMAVWPVLTLDECRVHLGNLHQAWEGYLNQLAPEEYSASISYRNSQGEAWQNSVQDILTHLIAHSHYHRGQIASELSANGITPAQTDFILAARQGFLE